MAATKTARDIFLAALDRAPADRAAYLDEACGDDAAIRQRVEALLRANDDPGAFLSAANPVVDDVAPLPPSRPLEQTVDCGPGEPKHRSTEEYTPEPEGSPSCPAATNDYRPLFEPGLIIAGRYTLQQKIGEGGMGEVWVAKQTEPVKRKVALKLIKTGMDSKAVLTRFELERQALAMMDHPNIARVFDGGMTPTGQPFFVMELVNGLPLNKFCDEMKLTPRERLELFVPICQAVQHAHQKGIVHRDLKPANILITMIDAKPVPKVIDFGVAKATAGKLTDESMSTQFGAIVGTLEYMSPEQAGFSGEDVDTRADIYSLGVILYELLTGLKPIDAKRLRKVALTEMIRIIREEEPSKPSTRLSTDESLASLAALRQMEPRKLMALLRGELDWVVMKCLEKQRERRYETANALARDVQRYLADEVVEARPPSARYRVQKLLQRNRAAVLALAAVTTSLLLGTIVSSYFAVEASSQAEKANHNAKTAEKEAKAARSAEMEAKASEKAEADAKAVAQTERKRAEEQLTRSELLVYAGKLSLAQSAFQDGKGGLALQYLDDCQWNLRGWEHRHLWTRFNAKQTFLGHANWLRSVAFSPDGKRIVTGSEDKTAKVWDAATGKEVLNLKGHTHGVWSVAISPDGKRIVTGSFLDKTAKVWDAATGRELLSLKGHTWSVAFSPDGKRLATCGGDNTAMVWDAATGKEVLSLKGHTHSVQNVAFSPDGTRIVTGSLDKTAKVWDAATGEESLTLKGHTNVVSCVAFSPDGKRIVTGSWDRTAKVWDAATGQELFALKGHSDKLNCVAFSPNGKRMVTGSVDTTAKMWEAATGQELFALKGHADWVSGVAFSPDGTRLVTASMDRTAKMWDAESGQEHLTLKGRTGKVNIAAFSPDGTRLVTASMDFMGGMVKVWDTATGQELFAIKGYTEEVRWVSFSPDGKRFVTASMDRTTKVFDATTGQKLFAIMHTDSVIIAVFSPDSTRLVTGNHDGTAKVWDAATGQEHLALNGHTAYLSSVAFSPDGKSLVTGSGDNTAKLWDAATGQELFALKGHNGGLTSVAFSPDGKSLVTCSEDRTAKVWDAATGQELFALKRHTREVYSAVFSPDGKRLVTGSQDKTAKVWDTATGLEVLTLKGHIGKAVFSPDGKRLVTGGVDKAARVLDAATGQELFALKGQAGNTVFDGKRIVTFRDDQPARVWDAPTGQESLTLTGHNGPVISAAFSPDGKRLVTGSQDQTAMVWDIEKGQELLALDRQTGPVWSVAFSPDGKRFVTGSGSRGDGKRPGKLAEVKVWGAEKGLELLALKGHTDPVVRVAVSPDGKRIFAWDAQKKVLAWSAADGKPIEPVDPPPAPPPGPERSADGFLRAVPQGNAIVVTDTRNPSNDNVWPLPDAATRRAYHSKQAALAEQQKHWFAATFHLRRVLLDDPENASVKTRLARAAKEHTTPSK